MGRICLNRAPRMKFKDLLGPQVQGMGRPMGYSCRVAKETGSGLVRDLAQERECICDAFCILFSLFAPNI